MTDQNSSVVQSANADLARRRHEYESAGLDADEMVADPIDQWRRWYDQAAAAGCVEPNAFVLATVDADGFPQTRYLLARGVDADGFVFYTNYDSAKSSHLTAHPQASMLFTWLQLHRQVRVVGNVQRATAAESDAYFASRPRASRLGAWASPQSQPLPDRDALDRRVTEMEATFAGVEDVPRPAFWGGWRLTPVSVEFWQGRPSRLHDRLRYTRPVEPIAQAGSSDSDHTQRPWQLERLAP